MIEEQFNIEAHDGKQIFCIHNRAREERSGRAVLIAHGLTGHPFEYVHQVARDYFVSHGYDVYRLAFYWAGEQYRQLKDVTIEGQHVPDLESVLAYMRESYNKVFVCGHSYGGKTIMIGNPEVTASALWDPSYISGWTEDAAYIEKLDCYRLDWAHSFMVGKQLVEEAHTHTAEKIDSYVAQMTFPSAVFDAEKGDMSIAIYDALNVDKAFYKIEGADHCFTKGNTALELMQQTHQWFERF